MPRRRKKNALDYIKIPRLGLDPETKKGIFIVFILALGALSLLGLFDMAGIFGNYLKDSLSFLFGWGRFVMPFILLLWGYMLYDEERFEVSAKNYIGIILFIFSFHALMFLFIKYGEWDAAFKAGQGGGFVGLLLAQFLFKFMGYLASLILTVSLFIVSILITFDTSLASLFGSDSIFAKLLFPLNFIFNKIINKNKEDGNEEDDREEEENEEEEEDEEEEEEEEEENEEEEEEENEEEEEEENEEEEEEENEEEEEGEEEKPPEFIARPVIEKTEEKSWWQNPSGIEIKIPLSLFNGKRGKPTSGDISENKNIIARTLENFNIPVEMGPVSVGPTVTQYTFKPAEGVKLSRITNLNNNLALSLASHPIRIEAPIPGKSLVGVEVPNQAKALVTFREILSSRAYKERKSNLMLALGKDVAGNSWLSDITKMPHLLVAGATNSGKSVCLNTIITSLMCQNNPDELRFIMVDPKRVELTTFNNIPYLLTPVITDVNKTINALKWCLNEMDKRYDLLNKVGTKNIQSYNESAKIKMPYIIFIIDELADLMVAAAKEIEAGVIRLAQMARAVGIHLILATQRPSVDVITGLIKANMPARIGFSVASGTDSRTILDTLGAEKLLGRGDMLFLTAEISKPTRLQGAFLSEDEIKKVVKYIIKKSPKNNYLDNITERQKVSGIGGIGLDGTTGDEDELLSEAKETVIKMGKASASLLQRKMRIGYARAASILDQLEELGIIGPAKGAKPREIFISREQYDRMREDGVSGAALHSREEQKMPDNFLGAEDSPDTPVEFKDPGESAEEENKNNNKKDEEDELFFAK